MLKKLDDFLYLAEQSEETIWETYQEIFHKAQSQKWTELDEFNKNIFLHFKFRALNQRNQSFEKNQAAGASIGHLSTDANEEDKDQEVPVPDAAATAASVALQNERLDELENVLEALVKRLNTITEEKEQLQKQVRELIDKNGQLQEAVAELQRNAANNGAGVGVLEELKEASDPSPGMDQPWVDPRELDRPPPPRMNPSMVKDPNSVNLSISQDFTIEK